LIMGQDEAASIEEYHARLNRIRNAEAEGVSAVGIFWVFPGMRLEYFSLPYTEGFVTGDYITVGAKHESHWNSLKRGIQQLNGDLKEFTHEYNHYPMGRVEYSKQTKTFIIYGPEIVNDDKVLKLIKLSFHLEDQIIKVIK